MMRNFVMSIEYRVNGRHTYTNPRLIPSPPNPVSFTAKLCCWLVTESSLQQVVWSLGCMQPLTDVINHSLTGNPAQGSYDKSTGSFLCLSQ